MAYVVTEPCIKCKHTDCAVQCPYGAFHEGKNFLVINPYKCVDCGGCVDECPVQAIYSDDEVPEKWLQYIDLNEKYAEVWPSLNVKRPALPEATAFASVEAKHDLFDPAPGRGN